jgi:hypothetical protein
MMPGESIQDDMTLLNVIGQQLAAYEMRRPTKLSSGLGGCTVPLRLKRRRERAVLHRSRRGGPTEYRSGLR